VEIFLEKNKVEILKGKFSDWIELEFKVLGFIKIKGICKFYLKKFSPHLELYMTPINISPIFPVTSISYPFNYSKYLYYKNGFYSTLGLAEDTTALNDGIIDEEIFLEQVEYLQEERKKMLFDSLENVKKGNITCVFDSTDRVQHMFWRYIDKKHNQYSDDNKYKNIIKNIYKEADDIIGKINKYVDDETALFVISDHGFCSFNRCFNLNTFYTNMVI